MSNRRYNRLRRTILVTCHLSLVAILFGCKKSETIDFDSQSTTNRANPFKSVEYYPSPNQTRMKTQLSGADAQPLEGGLLAIKQLKIEIFSTNGQSQVLASAPDCIYDSANRTANSSGRLLLQNGDGKIRVEGEGFLWRQNESWLTISNNVKTFIASMALAAGLSASAQNLANWTEISSHMADVDMNARRATYSGDVHVADPQMKLTCEWLVADLPQSGPVNHIVAKTNVVIDMMQTNFTAHATGDMAVYSYAVENGVTNETVTLTGQNPHVTGVRDGLAFDNWADEITWNRGNNGLHMKNQHGYFQKSETNSPTNTNPPSAPK